MDFRVNVMDIIVQCIDIDYESMGREKIERENPVIIAKKIEDIK